MLHAIVGLGSNLGSREAYVRLAAKLLGEETELVALSRMYVTAPIGPPQPDYVNAAVRIATELSPRAILARCLEIERTLGRVRNERWGARTIDLDLLYWEGGAIAEANLVVPHPRLKERAFAIAPMLDVAPELAGTFACEALAASPWSEPQKHRDLVTVEALDDADALAIALSQGIGPPARFAVDEPALLVRQMPCPGSVVIEDMGPPVRGMVFAPHLGDKPWDLVGLGGGRCVLRRSDAPKLL